MGAIFDRVHINGMTSLMDCDSSMYSLYVVERVNSIITNSVLDRTLAGLSEAVESQHPVKSASTKQSMPHDIFGLTINYLSSETMRYMIFLCNNFL